LSKVADFNLLRLHLTLPSEMTPFEFRQNLKHRKATVTGLLCGDVRDHKFSHCDRRTYG